MPKLIKDGELINDNWHLVDKAQSITEIESINAENLLIPIKTWQENKAELSQLNASIGLWFDSDESPDLLEEDANAFPVIAINFPVFKDGRAFSYAAIMRQQHNYQGDLRAIGDVLRDQLSYMLSCGFTSFLAPDEADENILLSGFNDFTENYQSTVKNPTPLFRRR